MTALHRKLVRDLWHLRGQLVAIVMVAGSGVAGIVTARTVYESLARSQSSYYAAYRFADVFASLKRAPERLARRIGAVPGVAAVRDRIVFDVTLDVPGLAEPATGRLLSIPERRQPMLNDLHLRRGRYLEPGRRDEVLVSEAFARANRLEVGATVGAILHGRWETLRIVGIALSPEYVYEIPGNNIFPDNRRFGVLWMSEDAMGPAFDMDGAFNDVVLGLEPGTNVAEVIARLDHLLEPYGGLGAIARADQVSHRFITSEIDMNRIFGTVVPAVFLAVAAFLLHVVMSRLVGTQRDQIGVLKAFGYSETAVALHYLAFALVAAWIGAVLGIALGLWLATGINELYAELYGFPVLHFEARLDTVLLGLAGSVLAALAGAFGAARRAFALPPAEAMRLEAPADYRAGVLERSGLQRRLGLPARMIVRNVARRPLRALLSTVGIAMAVAILILGRYFVDAIYHIADVQFRRVQREDVMVAAHDPLPSDARHELARLPGVMRSEPLRIVPARLRFGHRFRYVPVTGLDPTTEMRRLIDRAGREVAIPPRGVVLTTTLADLLGLAVGDELTVEVLEGARPSRVVPVVGLVDELIGLSAYMDARALHRLMQEDGTVSSSLLAVDPTQEPALFALLKRLPGVGGVGVREAQLRSFERTIGENMGISTMVLILFACVIVVAVVYNTSRIALSERGRELASLRVLGFTRAEITTILLGEHTLLTAAAIPLGYLLGYRVCALIAAYYQWEIFRLPLFVSPRTYLFAFWIVLAAALLTGVLVRRRLDRLDLVAVLKSRE